MEATTSRGGTTKERSTRWRVGVFWLESRAVDGGRAIGAIAVLKEIVYALVELWNCWKTVLAVADIGNMCRFLVVIEMMLVMLYKSGAIWKIWCNSGYHGRWKVRVRIRRTETG